MSRLERFLKYLTTSMHSLCSQKKINNVKKNKWKLLILYEGGSETLKPSDIKIIHRDALGQRFPL